MIKKAILKSKKAVIPYITAGLPDLEKTGDIIYALSHAGSPVIELGIPFSDPTADGPVLQNASKMALDAGFSLDAFFYQLEKWAGSVPAPLVVMSYINPFMRRGMSHSIKRLKECGAAGVIIPDLPRDASDIYSLCSSVGLDLIRLIAPTTTRERASEILAQCKGFVYAVSVSGVTGPRDKMPDGFQAQVNSIKELTDIPVCVGFGVSSNSQVEALLEVADGAIVGSYLVDKIMASSTPVKAVTDAYLGLTA